MKQLPVTSCLLPGIQMQVDDPGKLVTGTR
jgi:hypothetical protein